MKLTLSFDEELIRRARSQAEAMGTSVNQIIRVYLEEFTGKTDASEDAAEFEKLSYLARGHSQGWKFDREELHQRR